VEHTGGAVGNEIGLERERLAKTGGRMNMAVSTMMVMVTSDMIVIVPGVIVPFVATVRLRRETYSAARGCV
jgi:hypothetical protein